MGMRPVKYQAPRPEVAKRPKPVRLSPVQRWEMPSELTAEQRSWVLFHLVEVGGFRGQVTCQGRFIWPLNLAGYEAIPMVQVDESVMVKVTKW